MLVAIGGHVSEGYTDGHVTKDEYANTLRAHRASQDEMKSEQRAIAEEHSRLETEAELGC